jgi:hypothetical protein
MTTIGDMSTQSGPQNVQKLCTLLIHDSHSSKEDVIFNVERFPELGLQPGSLAKIVGIREGTAVRDFEKDPAAAIKSQLKATQSFRTGDSTTVTFDENGNKLSGGKESDSSRSYVFLVKEFSPEQKKKYHGTQVSTRCVSCNLEANPQKGIHFIHRGERVWISQSNANFSRVCKLI